MTRRLNVLVPMAGQGKRFRRAGYDTYKPFVKIFGKPMIEYVLDAFPRHVTKRVLADRNLLTEDHLAYFRARPDVVVHFVPPHEQGPAYSIHQARGELPLDESFFIAYCDIQWTWSWGEVERLVESGVDGVVYTRRSFHPHLVGSNFSAFCRATPGDPDLLEEIREKGSFTDDWMKEPLSIGCFYVRDGHAMMEAIGVMVAEDRRVSGEFFPSLLFNDLVRAGHTVRMQDVDFFVHWGVPAQLEDLVSWVRVCRRLAGPPPVNEAVNVCCMGGVGARMREMGTLPKALLPVADGTPMFRYVAQRFGCRSNVFVVNEHVGRLLSGAEGGGGPLGDLVVGERLIDIGPPTSSQLATLERASEFLAGQERFFLTSCDALGLWDPDEFEEYLGRERPDAVIFTFEPTLLQGSLGGSHTYVTTDGTWVRSVHIKHRPAGEARGLAGFFWFRTGEGFRRLDRIPEDPGHELCADHVLKTMVEEGKRVGAFPLEAYLHLGSPQELQEFEFWRRYHRTFPAEEGARSGWAQRGRAP